MVPHAEKSGSGFELGVTPGKGHQSSVCFISPGLLLLDLKGGGDIDESRDGPCELRSGGPALRQEEERSWISSAQVKNGCDHINDAHCHAVGQCSRSPSMKFVGGKNEARSCSVVVMRETRESVSAENFFCSQKKRRVRRPVPRS